MGTMLRISEAGSMGLHAAAILAANPDRLVPATDMASALGVSEAHLSKVLQRLVHAGLVESVRGRTGGFRLAKDGRKTSLLDVYEAIEGKLSPGECLLRRRVCDGKRCILGKLVHSVNEKVREYLVHTRLAQLAAVKGKA
jgi:Rrf2 family protein